MEKTPAEGALTLAVWLTLLWMVAWFWTGVGRGLWTLLCGGAL